MPATCTQTDGSGAQGAGVSRDLCLALSSNPRTRIPFGEPQGSGKWPEIASWKSEGSHLGPHPTETLEGLFLLCLFLPSAPTLN